MLAAGGYLVIAGLFGFLMLHGRGGGTGGAPVGPTGVGYPGNYPVVGTEVQGGNGFAPSQPDTAQPTTTTDTTTTTTDTSSQPVSGNYTTVGGPDGLSTEVPVGWTPMPTATPGIYQADDPADSSRFVRFGAVPAPTGDLVANVTGDEATNHNISAGYQRIQLQSAQFHGDPAADWEFYFTKAGRQRHVAARYWEQQGIEYVVYASSNADGWAQTQPIFAHLVDTAQP